MHALQKFSKKVNKALGGSGGAGGGNRRRTIAESTGLDTEDSPHEEGVDGLRDSAIKPSSSEENKGFVHNVSSGMENFIRAITDKPKPLPVRTTLPEDEEDGQDDTRQNGGGDAYALKNEPEQPQELDENTPASVLLARIEFLEVSLRNETERGNLLEEQVGILEDRLYQMERIGHRSILSRITRPFRMCFGLDRQPIAPQVCAFLLLQQSGRKVDRRCQCNGFCCRYTCKNSCNKYKECKCRQAGLVVYRNLGSL